MSTEQKTEPKAPTETPEQKRVREWDWDKEPHDWSTVPTNFTPEAYSPARSAGTYTGKSGEAVPFAGTTDEVRALPALKVLQKMGYTSTPPEPPATTEPTGVAARGLAAGRASGVTSPPR